MSEHNQELPKEVIEVPFEHFSHPMDIVESDILSKDEKIEALNAWEEDARRLSVATAEGMSGGEPSRMIDVAEAKTALEAEEPDNIDPTDAALDPERRPSPHVED